MSDKYMPEHIDPYRFAEQKLHLQGIVLLAEMSRLQSNLCSNEGKVTADLRFSVDEQGVKFVKGHLQSTLTLSRQRCLEPFQYDIVSDFKLGIVNTLEEANELSAQYEPVLTKEGLLAVRDLIEDELILNLPIIAKHDLDKCNVNLSPVEPMEKEIKKNPFQVLETLKKHK